jgi:hypothetical protein
MNPLDDWRVLGVDPAPSKQTVAFDGHRFHTWDAADVEEAVGELVVAARDEQKSHLITWDAPIALDPGSFYGRAVDKHAKHMVRGWADTCAPKAVGIAAAAQCPHNLLSMSALGLPVGSPKHGLRVLHDRRDLARGGSWIAEVHPAVAVGWWFHHRSLGLLERYKNKRSVASEVFATLTTQVPSLRHLHEQHPLRAVDVAAFTDDHLDAWVAWALGALLVDGRAQLWRGPPPHPDGGYYVLPRE